MTPTPEEERADAATVVDTRPGSLADLTRSIATHLESMGLELTVRQGAVHCLLLGRDIRIDALDFGDHSPTWTRPGPTWRHGGPEQPSGCMNRHKGSLWANLLAA
jgi:hypothetical protein